ncbi:MAG TPA: TonB-dependent receptor [Polyangiaceae bacterium]|nr:TonB-dependent receptor [Polyangiaceae bacterium]
MRRPSARAAALAASLAAAPALAQPAPPARAPAPASPAPRVAPAASPAAPRVAQAAPPGEAAPAGPKLTRPPKLVTFVEADYPEAERAAGRSAAVVLRLTVAADGSVSDAAVAESAGPAFDAAAVAAARRFVFEPAEIDGKPRAIKILYRYEFTIKAEAPTRSAFSGVVRRRGTGAPIARARVELDTGQRAETGPDGRFRIDDVEPGPHAVTLSAEGLPPQRSEETFEAGRAVEATYDVGAPPQEPAGEQDDLEVVVVAPPLRKDVVSTEISAEQGRRVPGTQGDVLKVVENMPGVARPPLGSGGGLVVWGAAPQDTRVYVEGVRLPLLYHFGGVRSVLSSDFVRSVELSPGAYGVPYGRGLGGLVTVGLKPLDAKTGGSVGADLLDASASVRAPLGDRFRVAVAGRRSHLHSVFDAASDEDVGDLFPLPRYHDAQARLVYEASPRESLELGGLLSRDEARREVANPDPTLRKSESRVVGFERVYLRYRRDLEGGASVDVTPSFGRDRSSLDQRFGPTPVGLSSEATVYALRAGYRARLNPELTLSVGFDGEASSAKLRRAGSIGAPAREGDRRAFGQAPSDQVSADSWRTLTAAAAGYGELDYGPFGGRLHLGAGLRFEPQLIGGSRRTPVEGDTPAIGYASTTAPLEPRLSARFEITPRLSARAAYGIYHQAPAAEDLSAAFGNPLLPPAKAQHALAGLSVRPAEKLVLEATAFRATQSGLAVRSPLAAPPLAQGLVPEGEGRAYGTQFLLRQEITRGFFGWVTYTIARSERRDRPGAGWRLFDFDQSHVLTALASYDLGRGFEVGLRARYATGLPRTPVVGAYYDARGGAFQPLFGTLNGTRLPPFFQLDLRASKRTRLGPGELETYLDVQNATMRENAEEIAYSADYGQRKYVTGLPLLPVAGARWSW